MKVRGLQINHDYYGRHFMNVKFIKNGFLKRNTINSKSKTCKEKVVNFHTTGTWHHLSWFELKRQSVSCFKKCPRFFSKYGGKHKKNRLRLQPTQNHSNVAPLVPLSYKINVCAHKSVDNFYQVIPVTMIKDCWFAFNIE